MVSRRQHIVRLERDTEDSILPKDFFDVMMKRFLPVISLTYIAAIFGIAANTDDLWNHILYTRNIYVMALPVALWVAIPGFLWIFLNASPLYRHVADVWYKIIAVIMILTIGLSYLLFPEGAMFGLRIYFVISIPVLVIMYFFFVRRGLPSTMAYPLNALGFVALAYGAIISI